MVTALRNSEIQFFLTGMEVYRFQSVRYRKIKVLRFYNHKSPWSYAFPLVFLRKGAALCAIIRAAPALFKVPLRWLHIPQPPHCETVAPLLPDGHEITAGEAGDPLGESKTILFHSFPNPTQKKHSMFWTIRPQLPPTTSATGPVGSFSAPRWQEIIKTQIIFCQLWALNQLPKRPHQVAAGKGGTEEMLHPFGGTKWSACL